MDRIDLKCLTALELSDELATLGEPKFRAKQIYEWMHQKLVVSPDEMTNVSKNLREKLKENYAFTALEQVAKLVSKDGETEKYLFRLSDDNVIESVLMRYHHGNSVCISSQVGCRMGCSFCASTIGGLVRNLSAAEMLEQVYSIQRSSGERVSNVVVMGTGEPLDNFDQLVKFVRMLTDEQGLHISQRNVTVSTCGLVPKMRELADLDLAITPALSLHAPNDELRKKIMPVANAYSIEELMSACDYYYEKTGRRMTFEYSLMEGVNDSVECARELCRILKGKNCHVNLIPVNPVKERDYRRTVVTNVLRFQKELEKGNINATIRKEMGTDIDAACGQLRRTYMQAKEQS